MTLKYFDKSCHTCQRVGHSNDSPPVPLRFVPMDSEIFEKWRIDLIGPFDKPTCSGKKYIIAIFDYAFHAFMATHLTKMSAANLVKAPSLMPFVSGGSLRLWSKIWGQI